MIEITMKTMKLILRLQKQLLKYSGRRTKIANIQKISDVCCAVNHILLLSVISDQVYVCGNNYDGYLGLSGTN